MQIIKGMHDIGTMTGQTGVDTSPLPGTRQQALGQLVQLEAERPRLQRQLDLLAERRQRTQARLKSARRRTEMLMRMVNASEPAALGVKKSDLFRRRRPAKARAKKAETGHETTMQY